MKRFLIISAGTFTGIMMVIATFIFAIGSDSSSARHTPTSTPRPAPTATVSSAAAPTSSAQATPVTPPTTASSSTPAAPVGPYLVGALDVQFPAGDPGVISVVAQGPRSTGAYGTKWVIVVRNNTGATASDDKATMAATSGGKIVGSHSVDSFAPAVVADGGIAFSSAYFDTQLPEDATVEFTFTHKQLGKCYNKPAVIGEVNAVPAYGGTNLVGKLQAGAEEIGGPISIDVLCMDGNGQLLSGGTASGFADQDELAPGQSGTFSVDPSSGPCDQYLLAASGYGF